MKSIKIIHCIESIDNSTGGPARSVTMLIQKLIDKSQNKFILISKNTISPIITGFQKINNSLFLINTANEINKIVDTIHTEDFLIFHGHGIWQSVVHRMAKLARAEGVPYIITPRGMLEPWSLSQKRIKKLLALLIFQRKDLSHACVIHATSKMEEQSIRKLGFKNPIAIIPNGLDLNPYPITFPNKNTKSKKILFLSRIHPKKGIENLLNAWSQIDSNLKENWEIEIVGNGEKRYISTLKKRIVKMNMNSSIKIKDAVYGEEKVRLFCSANLFVLPSYSENFGMVVAEALASFTPVITTKATPWKELIDYECGWWIEMGIESLKIALVEAITQDNENLKNMGLKGRQLIESRYNINNVSQDMDALYYWIQNKEKTPKFITFC